MFDSSTWSAWTGGSTPSARAQAVRDSLGNGTLTVELRNGETLVYSGTFTGPMAAGSDGSLSADVLLSGVVTTGGTPNAATWTCRIRNADGRYVEGSFGPGGRFTWSGGALVVGQAVRLRVSIAANGVTLPTWRSGMTTGTWIEVPTSNTLADLNPKNNAAINPEYPSNPEWYGSGHHCIVTAWCGGCLDAATDTLWLPLGGGHGDYAGNEPYRVRLDLDAPTFEMVRWPSGAIGNLLTTRDGQEATGVYSDGRPRSIHSYNKPVYVPGLGPVISVQGNCSWTATGPAQTVLIDPNTGEATLGAVCAAAGASSGGGACYDESRHAIWFRGAGTGTFAKYDIAADAWASAGSSKAVSGYSGLCRLPDDDSIVWLNNGLANGFAVFDCATNTLYEPSISGSLVGATALRGHMQPQWVPSLGAVAVWDNSSDTTVINLLTPGANPRTDAWTISQLSVDAGNAVTPTEKAHNGTYGRFAYSSRLDGFFVLNATNQKPYFFALG